MTKYILSTRRLLKFRVVLVTLLWFVYAISPTALYAQIKFKFNNVDTISPLNQELISFFGKWLQAKTAYTDDSTFWVQDDEFRIARNDSYEEWIYGAYAFSPQTILGLSIVGDNQYKIKVALEMGKDSTSQELYAIQNFMVVKTDKGFKMQDFLLYNLKKERYTVTKDKYFDFYFPPTMIGANSKIAAINNYVAKIERYFEQNLPYNFKYIYAPDCESLNSLRGYDYVATMMSTKTRTCGLTDTKNRIMYSSYNGVHKHELLRLLNVILPKSPPILMDGFTNLVGGAGGKPIMYHLRKLAPYILEKPEVLDDIESFYYYDDETNPHFVFNAISTNYFIKTKGENEFKRYMARTDLPREKLAIFLKNHCGITDVKSFFISQFEHYKELDSDLEFINQLL